MRAANREHPGHLPVGVREAQPGSEHTDSVARRFAMKVLRSSDEDTSPVRSATDKGAADVRSVHSQIANYRFVIRLSTLEPNGGNENVLGHVPTGRITAA